MREENRRVLAENGRVILLERNAESILFDGSRPLSDNKEKWNALWQKRAPIYRAFADITITDFQSAEDACRRISEELK